MQQDRRAPPEAEADGVGLDPADAPGHVLPASESEAEPGRETPAPAPMPPPPD